MKGNSNSLGSEQEIVEWFKCNKCGKFFHYKHMQITNYQEYPGAALSVEYSSPCCNSMDIEQVLDQELTENICSGGGRMTQSQASNRDHITSIKMRTLVLIKIRKGLLHSPDSPYSTIHPPRRPAATHRSMAGLQPAHPEVTG